MATGILPKELVVDWKKQIFLNLEVLSYTKTMPPELSRPIFEENALEKLTQNVFNHLTYYLLQLIDSKFVVTITWPLYDTNAERAYRKKLSEFITLYSSKNMVTNVISSYLVNPACYKVTKLLHQLSLIAVQKQLLLKRNENQRTLYDQVEKSYKSDNREGFIDYVKVESQKIRSKFSGHIKQREQMEKIAAKLRQKILDNRNTLSKINAQDFLNNIVDKFIAENSSSLDNETKCEILKEKDIEKASTIFDNYLLETDKRIEDLESQWDEKITPFLTLCQTTKSRSEQLISRHMGQEDKSLYMIEYNHKTDEINTKELQTHVNSEQKSVLINLVSKERLNFPNLIRSFVISICYILKDSDVNENIYKFNECLKEKKKEYGEVVSTISTVLDRVKIAEAMLNASATPYDNDISFDDLPEIPPLPDLSELCNLHLLEQQIRFEGFTPLNTSKHQFNLNRRNLFSQSFSQPRYQSLVIQICPPREDFQMFNSCRTMSSRHNMSQHFHNMSIIPQTKELNATTAECRGFTKEQMQRLLSTKSKKFTSKKNRNERNNIHIRKGALFDSTGNDSNGLFRCHSSPNLYENREKSTGNRKLSIMPEDNVSTLEVSGISVLRGNTENSTEILKLNNNTPLSEALKDFKVDLDKEFGIDSPKPSPIPSVVQEIKAETPKHTLPLIKKTSSLEKIINRFNRVKADALNDVRLDSRHTIAEEKENVNANRVLLPDLLSPSCSGLSQKTDEDFDKIYMDIEKKSSRKPRESLGTALGVDQTFLDQFDLID